MTSKRAGRAPAGLEIGDGTVRRDEASLLRRPAVFLCLAFLLGAANSAPRTSSAPSGRQDRALDILPPAADLKGWTRAGQPEVYQGEALYEYIDGGAEIYQEYGFREVAVQDYKSPAGRTVTVEVYVMASPAAAYGIYSFKTTGEGRAADWSGVEGEIETYYLNVWRGSVLATVTGLDENAETLEGVTILGRATAAKLSGSREKPVLVRSLPETGLKPRSTKYFRGRLGLMNAAALFPGRGFPFADGVRGLYVDGSELLIFATGSVAEAQAALQRAREEARAGGRPLADAAPLSVGLVERFVLIVRSASADRAAELRNRAAANLAGR